MHVEWVPLLYRARGTRAARTYTPDGRRFAAAIARCCIIACALWVLAAGICVHAAQADAAPPGHYIFRSYGPTDGLVNTAVSQLVQDQQGFIWAGTDDALYRYDGYRFDAFGTEQGLPGPVIEALHTDTHGVLWVGTHGGLAKWNGLGFDNVPVALGADDTVHALADDTDGLWVASSAGLHVRGDDLRFRAASGWPGGEATALTAGKRTRGLWVARWDGAAHILRYDAGWHSYAMATDVSAERIDAFAEDAAGHVWARSLTQLWLLNEAQHRFEPVITPAPLSGTNRGYLFAGRRGDLWIPTNDLVLHRDGERWVDVIGGPALGTRPVLEDREGSLWFGARGLQRLAGRGVFYAYDISEGVPGNVVWSIVRDRERNLWIGTERGLARNTGKRFETIPGSEAYTVRTVVSAPDGKFYFGGIPAHDLLSYDPAHKILQHVSLGAIKAPTRILHLCLDRAGVLWVTTDTAGLLKADTHEATLHFTRETLPGETADEVLRGIHEDQTGRLWVAGQNGLLLREHEQWRRFTVADGLLFNKLTYVQGTHSGDLLVVYAGTHGFDRMRYDAGKLRTLHHVAAGSARYIDEIFLIGEDANDNIWAGSGRGVDLHNAKGGTEHFGAQQGLIGEDTASMAFLADPNGDVWFGVVGGLMRFDATKFSALPERAAPPAQLLDMRLGEQRFAPGSGAVQVPHLANTFQVRFASASFRNNGVLQYATRLDGLETTAAVGESREARYSALAPGKYVFEVTARVGAHGAWGEPATFAFEILPAWWQTWWARTLFGLALLLAIVLAVRWRIAALQQHNRLLEENIAARTAELSEANRLLVSEIGDRIDAEDAVQQRNAELEELNRRLAGTQSQLLQSEKMASVGQLAAGVAHEINNPIGFVQSNLNSLKRYVRDIFDVLHACERLESALPAGHPDLVQLRTLKQRIDLEFLRNDTDNLLAETVEGVTRVQKIVKDLKDFSHVDEAEWQRIDLHQSLDSTLNVVAHELKYKADLVKQYGTLPQIECLPFQINQVFVNLLVNAVQAIDGHGTITLRTYCEGEFACASITDTGKGIDPAVMHRIFDPFFTTKPVGVGTGLGLSVSYGIVQKHGGTIHVESTPGVGTTFTVRLPIGARQPAQHAGAASPLESSAAHS